jgi:4-amino-4-deoxy-L-arabinose transferase-like glycosyltransferase
MPRTERTRLALIALFWLVMMFAGLGNTALWEPDEPRFAEATRQMFARGDFLTPWFNDRPRFEKPILLYWLQTPFVAVLGPTETAFRIPAALAGLLTLLLVYRLARDLVSADAGLIAALTLATTFRFILYARQSLTDVPVTFFVTLSIWLFLRAHDAPEGQSRRDAWLGWAATGLAALTKGPVAVLGPAIWVAFGLIYHRQTFLRRLHPVSGVLVAAAITLPWHLYMIALHGRAFLDVALGYEVVARYLSEDFPGRDRGIFYFVGVWFGDAAPWSLFFVSGAIWLYARWRELEPGIQRLSLLALIWFGFVLALFSVSQYKLPHYIMPAYPPTALLTGVFLAAVIRGARTRRVLWTVPAILSAVLLLVGAVLLALLLRRAFELELSDVSFVLPIAMTAGGLTVALSAIRYRARTCIWALLTTLTTAYAFIVIVIAPRELRRFQPIPGLAASVRSVAQPGDALAVAGNYGAPGLVFYARMPVRQLVDRADLVAFLSEPGRRHCVLPRTDFEAVAGEIPRRYRIVDEGAVFSVRMRRLIERTPERAGRTLVLISAE